MNKILHDLYLAQQALEVAESADEVAQALPALLASQIDGAAFEVVLDAGNAGLDQPAVDANGARVTVPLLVGGKPYGLLSGRKSDAFTPTELAFILAQSNLAAIRLDRLSWPASPLVFRQLVENANVAIDVADIDGVITYANEATARMYGFGSAADLVGRNVSELYTDNWENTVKEQLQNGAPDPEGWIGNVMQQRASGTPFPVELALFGLRDPRLKRASFGAILQDRGEIQRLFNEVQAKTRNLQSVNRVGSLLLASLDRNRVLVMAAEQMVHLLSVDQCGIAIIDEHEIARIVAQYPPPGGESFKMSIRDNPLIAQDPSSDVFISVDVAHDARLDSLRDWLGSLGVKSILTVRLEAKGKLIGLIALACQTDIRDFTDDEVATCRTLARQIALALENSDLYEQALTANRIKSEFFMTISHELRTPLNAILGYAEMMVSGRYGQITDQQQDRLGRVVENAQQLSSLIDDILQLSRLDAGKMHLDLKAQDISPVIRAAMERIAPQAKQKHLSITVDLPETLPSVVADAEQVSQIMTNLVSNAIKFTHEGSIHISAAPLTVNSGAEDGQKSHTALTAGDWLLVSIRDTGIGIAAENFNLIFDSFRQVDGSTAREFEGIGLGLALARQYTELQGGKLWVESEVGQGSTFTVALPITDTNS